MMDEKNENLFTVQGRDTPVPVRSEGDEAGPTGPSASDCNSQTKNESKDVPPNPFERRSSILRTPPKPKTSVSEEFFTPTQFSQLLQSPDFQEECLFTSPSYALAPADKGQGERSFSDGDMPEMLLNSGNRPHKRKRVNTPQQGAKDITIDTLAKTDVESVKDKKYRETGEVYKNTVEEILKEIDLARKIIGEMYKPKQEIKEVILNLAAQAKKLRNQHMMNWIKEAAMMNTVSNTDTGTQTDKNKTIIDAGTQTNMDNRDQELLVLRTLKSGSTYNAVADILNLDWPEEAYKITSEEVGNPAKADHGWDVALALDPNDEGERGLLKTMMETNPDIKGLLSIPMQPSGLEFITNTTKTMTSRGGNIEKTTFLYLIPTVTNTGDAKSTVDDLETFYASVKKLKETMATQKRTKILFATTADIDRKYSRKILEYVFQHSETRIKCLIPAKNRRTGRETEKRAPNSTVTIKAEGKTYAELLKEVKKEVDISKIGVGIKKIRKTGKGDLTLTVEGGKVEANVLSQEIKNKLENLDVTTRSNATTVYIMGMDITTTKNDVKVALTRETKVEEREIEIKAIRPGKYEDSTAIVELPREVARTLINVGTIKVGWVKCAVREKVVVLRCYNCLEFGHRSKNCEANKARSEECINCGETGHRAKECKNNPYCARCKKSGHRSDHIKCPHFRKLVEEVRRKRIRRFSDASMGRRGSLLVT